MPEYGPLEIYNSLCYKYLFNHQASKINIDGEQIPHIKNYVYSLLLLAIWHINGTIDAYE